MATPASLPPIKTKTYDLALDKLPPSDFETYDLALNSLPSDFETYDLAPAGPLPSGKDLRLTSPGMHEERRQDAGMQAVRWESARSCWRVLVDGLTITDSRASWRVCCSWNA